MREDYASFENGEKPAIAIGLEACDLVSGLRGIVTGRAEHDHGMIRWGLTPRGDGKTLPESYDFDEAQLEVVSWGIYDRVKDLPQAEFPEFTFGSIVKDRSSQYKGKIVGKHRTLNGCMLFTVQADTLTKDGQSIYQAYNGNVLELVKPVAPVEIAAPQKRERTGPPPTPSVRAR